MALPGELFDSDVRVRELLETESIRDAVRTEFGNGILDRKGALDRAKIRDLVFHDSEKRSALEKILHPEVRRAWTERVRIGAGKSGWFFVDIPLLFETHVEALLDTVVLVACSPWLQKERLMKTRAIEEGLAEKMISSQLDLPTKLGKAGHVIWNGGTLACLQAQTRFLAEYFKERYGRKS